jgi:hypothetical protein
MDHFGIGAALKGAARICFTCARRTGRTTSLLNSLKDGDRIVTLDGREAERLRRELRQRKLEVDVVVLDPARPEPMRYGTPVGRTLFDHMWVERFYELAIEQASADIDGLQAAMSGWGEAHEKTRRAAATEPYRWPEDRLARPG